MRGRPTLLGQKLDTLVQKFLRATNYKGGVVNTQTALATGKALVKRYPSLGKENLVFGAPWAKSLFHHMGFVLRRKTNAKVLIPEGARKKSRIEISPPNCQLRGEEPDTTIANYQFQSGTFKIRPNFFKCNGKERDKKRSNLWNR